MLQHRQGVYSQQNEMKSHFKDTSDMHQRHAWWNLKNLAQMASRIVLEIISGIKGLKTMEETVYKGNLGIELSWCS